MASIRKQVALGAAAGMLGLALVASTSAQATEGYFQHGYGARAKALGGAGAADGRDAMTMALNPAGLVHVRREQLQGGISVFSPRRSFTRNAVALSPIKPGKTNSSSNFFPIPNVAYSRPLDENSVIGIAMYGNGGMNTDYQDNSGSHCTAPPLPVAGGAGVFCNGDTGVNLNQMLVAPTYARTFMDRVSIGISPILAMQMIEVKGLSGFTAGGAATIDLGNFSNRGTDFSFGAGGKIGVEVALADNIRVGGFYQSRIYMSRFKRYRGLFAEKGDFDIPQNFQIGVAVDAMPNLTFMFDYKRIFYGDVRAIANSSALPPAFGGTNGVFGANNGPGFGWHDIDILKVGAEWRANEDLTVRAGFSYNENPIKSSDVTLNLIAPGIVKYHFTGGFSYQIARDLFFDFAGVYVPANSVKGQNPIGAPGDTITIRMHQYDFKGGLTYNFGGPDTTKN